MTLTETNMPKERRISKKTCYNQIIVISWGAVRLGLVFQNNNNLNDQKYPRFAYLLRINFLQRHCEDNNASKCSQSDGAIVTWWINHKPFGL